MLLFPLAMIIGKPGLSPGCFLPPVISSRNNFQKGDFGLGLDDNTRVTLLAPTGQKEGVTNVSENMPKWVTKLVTMLLSWKQIPNLLWFLNMWDLKILSPTKSWSWLGWWPGVPHPQLPKLPHDVNLIMRKKHPKWLHVFSWSIPKKHGRKTWQHLHT